MDYLAEFSSSPARVFAVFFSVSFALLGLILLIGLVTRISRLRRSFRQLRARRTRSQRMLADHGRLREDARKLEGFYYFGESEPSVDIYADEARTSSDAA